MKIQFSPLKQASLTANLQLPDFFIPEFPYETRWVILLTR